MAKQAADLTPARQRIHWVDCAKAIGSLLVIIGHTRLEVRELRVLIYSFHMPLFFLLSGVTFRFSRNSTEFLAKTQKTFRHLMLPTAVLFAISTVVNALRNTQVLSTWGGVLEYVRSVILQASCASGVPVSVFSAEIPAMGMPWFLVTLALGRILADYLHLRMGQRKFVVSCVVLSFIGVIVGRVQYLPLSFDIVLVPRCCCISAVV